MIHEKFLLSAVNIRRKYLSINSSLQDYHHKTKDILEVLNKSMEKLEALSTEVKKANSGKINMTDQEALAKVVSIIQDVEDKGLNIEKMTDPLNSEIEKLAVEEQQLYQQIKIAHPNLTDQQILESVQTRLRQEGLD